MNYIDFSAAVECFSFFFFYRSDIIRTEKLYKIAAVFNNQDKEISLHPPLPLLPPTITAPLRASKCSKFGKV